MRAWSIEVWLLDDTGREIPATVFEKVVYNLHPTFERPKQSECATVIFLPAFTCSVGSIAVRSHSHACVPAAMHV
jgi:hypothetical protein